MTKPMRRVRGIVSMVRLVRDPNRLEEVFHLIDVMDSPEIIEGLIDGFEIDPKGARALAERPRVGKIDLLELRKLPAGTLGREYAEHMIKNGLDPSAIPSLKSYDKPTFVHAHLYETHDIWHAVTGFDTDVAGELGLQAFGLAQFPSRLGAALIAGGLIHAILKAWDDRDARMRQIVRGWVMGRRAEKFFGERWGEMWERPMADVRRALGVDLAAIDSLVPAIVRTSDVRAAA